jgi:hypothetical protein
VQRAKPFAGVRGVPEKSPFPFAAGGGESKRIERGQIPYPRKSVEERGVGRESGIFAKS